MSSQDCWALYEQYCGRTSSERVIAVFLSYAEACRVCNEKQREDYASGSRYSSMYYRVERVDFYPESAEVRK